MHAPAPLFKKTGEVLAVVVDEKTRTMIEELFRELGIEAQVEPTAFPEGKYIFAPGPIARYKYQTVITDENTHGCIDSIREVCEKERLRKPRLFLLENDHNSSACKQTQQPSGITIIDTCKDNWLSDLRIALDNTLTAA
jgi:hypothetical protein